MPIERRTRAPAPSLCSVASKALEIWRGEVVVRGSSIGGITGRPAKLGWEVAVDIFEAWVRMLLAAAAAVVAVAGLSFVESCMRRESMYGWLQ